LGDDRRPLEATPRVRVGRGARATEELLLSDLEALLPSSASDLALLARPVIVVVPSRSLRVHLAERLVARCGRAVAGVAIVTLHGLAADAVGRCEGRRTSGARLLSVFVARFARREPSLARLAGGLEDGELPVIATVRDLLDAGFTAANSDALAELLQGHADEDERERAAALARIAGGIGVAFEAGELELPSDLLRRAADLLKADPERALPARAVLVHGFADATGLATDLIETLLRVHRAWLYLDRPPDPVEPTRDEPGCAFSERFLGRLRGVVTPEPAVDSPPSPAPPAMFSAPGVGAEVREIARRIRVLLDGGARPERIAVVGRDLAAYAAPIQAHFGRLAVPFCAPGAAGSGGTTARRLRALAELLQRGPQAATGSWLVAGARDRFDLRLALQVCRAARLGDVAALAAEIVLDEHGELVLPIRRGLTEVGGDDEDRPVAPHRRLPGGRLRAAVRRAATLVALLEAWPAEAEVAQHVVRLRRFLDEATQRWGERPDGEPLRRLLSTLGAELPAGLRLSREEFFVLVRRELDGAGAPPLGGAGAGVQVLSVVEARARTFTHLFIVGLNRDTFPRQVREDPLLPDRLRRAIERDVLPGIPIKRTGFDEERYLFAQLLSSSANVTLSWQACDDDGRARPPSPLVERLRLGRTSADTPLVGPVLAPVAGELRPADEHALLAGLYGTRRAFASLLGAAAGDALAAARLAVLEEIDPDRRTAEGRRRAATVGPYAGFIGPPREGADPRRGDPAVTTAEALAACPWQAFLRRIMRLQPPPDPLAAATGVEPALVGEAVHRVLQAIVSARDPQIARTVGDALAARAVETVWPPAVELERTLHEICLSLVRERGLTTPGVERVVEVRTRPFLEVAHRLTWTGAVSALAIEAEGRVEVKDATGNGRLLPFRADLVERREEVVILTDFKTGGPLSRAQTAAARRRHLLAALRKGEALQAAAYALAVSGRRAEGRYLYLRPDLEDGLRELVVEAGDHEPAQGFAEALRVVLRAWDLGSLFPRLQERDTPREPRRCAVCEVRDACVRGDSGARRRLVDWVEARRVHGAAHPLADAEDALVALWTLGATRNGGGEEEAP
jgi:RecB family exonuclease